MTIIEALNRLTVKDKSIRDNFNAEYAKLADLEDIEEELGIDLITLFKALENGVWNLIYDERVLTHDDVIIYDLTKFKTMNQEDIYFKDYGKTWALTKEELEK